MSGMYGLVGIYWGQQMTNKFNLRYSLSRAISCVLASVLCVAQGARAANEAIPSGSAAETTELQEVVVTAQRRAESIQKVPLTVSAFSTEQLERLSINAPKNLEFSTPGLTFADDNNTLNPYIRGRGTNFSGSGLEGSVAVYFDDVYLQTQYSAGGSLVDVAQVQVLKGPQGTLYGRNATGGAIVVTTNDPKRDFEGYVQAGYGNLNWSKNEAVLNVPVTDTLSMRLVADYERRDGQLTNIIDGKDQGGGHQYLVRLKTLWQPVEAFSADLKLEFLKSEYGYLRRQLVNGAGQPTGLGFYNTFQSPKWPDAQGGENDSDVSSATVRLIYKLGDWTMTNVTGYRRTHVTYCAEGDNVYPALNNFCTFTPPGDPRIPKGVSGFHDDALTNEFRVNSSMASPLNATAGLSYEYDRNRFPAIIKGDIYGGLEPYFDNYTSLASYAVFAELYWDIVQNLKLTVGGRYSKDFKSITVFNSPDVAPGFGLPPGVLPDSFEQSAAFTNFTPRTVLAYDFGDANVYISYNKGFKSGGFNAPQPGMQTPLRPETIEGLEFGVKTKLLNDRVRLDVAAFHTKAIDVQVASIEQQFNTVVQQNAAGANASGLEVNMDAALPHSLELQLGAAYLHSRFTSFPAAAVYGIGAGGLIVSTKEDLAGYPTVNSPNFTGNANLSYPFTMPAGWSGRVTASGRYTSAYDTQAGRGGPLRLDYQGGFALMNLTGQFNLPGNKFTISWYVNNVTDKQYNDQVLTGSGLAVPGYLAGGTYAVPALPRTYGGNVRYSF
ncbi:MAG: iron complex outerrane recepter protein [Acidobacteriaceae bacterium]|jgi:iron complex outermembrane receptor protein|nr:iron complex outerrane recepter protein [Acidobacteriaceae bacterium]